MSCVIESETQKKSADFEKIRKSKIENRKSRKSKIETKNSKNQKIETKNSKPRESRPKIPRSPKIAKNRERNARFGFLLAGILFLSKIAY